MRSLLFNVMEILDKKDWAYKQKPMRKSGLLEVSCANNDQKNKQNNNQSEVVSSAITPAVACTANTRVAISAIVAHSIHLLIHYYYKVCKTEEIGKGGCNYIVK